MMRTVTSDRIEDFAALYDDDVELISVARRRPDTPSVWDAACPQVQARWEQAPGDRVTASQALARSLDEAHCAALAHEVALASEVLADLLDCTHVGVRANTLSQPMCPRFHVDKVPCRLLITMSGPGTEWIASDEVDPVRFADRGSNTPPLRPGASIRQLDTANWSLLKGGSWNSDFGGVVHRSPHRSGERLLVTLDPIFA